MHLIYRLMLAMTFTGLCTFVKELSYHATVELRTGSIRANRSGLTLNSLCCLQLQAPPPFMRSFDNHTKSDRRFAEHTKSGREDDTFQIRRTCFPMMWRHGQTSSGFRQKMPCASSSEQRLHSFKLLSRQHGQVIIVCVFHYRYRSLGDVGLIACSLDLFADFRTFFCRATGSPAVVFMIIACATFYRDIVCIVENLI